MASPSVLQVTFKQPSPLYGKSTFDFDRLPDAMTNSNSHQTRIYLDNAATSFPKPDAVWQAMDHFNRNNGCAVGRGTSEAAQQLAATVLRCRRQLCRLLGAHDPSQVILTFNGTDSLNQAIHGLCRQGDHVVVSDQEHNSVTRPLFTLAGEGRIQLTVVASRDDGRIDPDRFNDAVRSDTRMIVCQHASNVTGLIHPIADIVDVARSKRCISLIDAAQTMGCLPLNLTEIPADVVCAPGHKGLLGPLGTGVLYLRPGIEKEIRPLRQGGTGASSESELQPTTLPEMLESGNHNAPGIVGLDAALGYVLGQGPDAIHRREIELLNWFIERLAQIPTLRMIGHRTAERVALVSVTAERAEPQILASLLDQEFHVETRAGLHCAPAAHRMLGTLPAGTLRFSLGPFTTQSELEIAAEAIHRLSVEL